MCEGERLIVSFFGHSKTIIDINQEDFLSILENIVKDAPVEFLLGMYGDFDFFAYACAKEYKKRHPNAKLVFVTPYIHENYCLLEDAKERFDEIVYPELEKVPKRYAIIRRNEYMINESDFIIFYVTHHHGGGAYMALEYAKRKNKPYINISNKLEN